MGTVEAFALRSMRRAVPLVVVLVALVAPGAAGAVVTNVNVQSGYQQTGLTGQPYAQPLVVRVSDGADVPVAGVTVDFESLPDNSGTPAAAVFSAPSDVTDANGLASVEATANASAGGYIIEASVDFVVDTADFNLVNRWPGFAEGDQLRSVSGPDQHGTVRNLRDFLGGGKHYAMIDFCTPDCPACGLTQEGGLEARRTLKADHGIVLNVVPALTFSALTGYQPSTAGQALTWAQANPDKEITTLHSNSDGATEMFAAGISAIFADFPSGPTGFPTSLYVRPDGTIIRRAVGGMFVDDLVDMIADDAASHPIPPPGGGAPPLAPPVTLAPATLGPGSTGQQTRKCKKKKGKKRKKCAKGAK